MYKLTISLFAMMALVVGCSGSGSMNGKSNTAAAGTPVNTDVMGYTEEDVPRYPTEPTNPDGPTAPPESLTPPDPNVPMLPSECNGVVPQGTRLGANLTSCRCADSTMESLWTTYVWDKEDFPRCKVPHPVQVLRRKLVATTASTTTTRTESTQASRTSISRNCVSRMTGETRIAVCQVKRDSQPIEEFSCIGQGVIPLTLAEQANYAGGAPCTCKSGPPEKMGDRNIWQCK
jgi:hypothetical protein